MPKRTTTSSGRFTRTADTAEADAEALTLRTQGLNFRQIATQQGIAVSAAYKRVNRALAAIPFEAVEEHRRLQCELIDAVIVKFWDIVTADHPFINQGRRFEGVSDAGPVIAALNGILKASAEKRKLLGLDAPARQTITVVTEDAVDAELRRLELEMSSLEDGAV